MSNDPTRQVTSATHPSGHPNKTPVNAENPIFGPSADPVVVDESIEQAGIAQSDKHQRETVQSPLINENMAGPADPVVEVVDAGTGQEAAGKEGDVPAETPPQDEKEVTEAT